MINRGLSAQELRTLLSSKNLVSAAHLAPQLPAPPLFQRNFVTDSRLVKPGDCFVAYRGANANSHQFLEAAHQQGARLLIIEEDLPLALTGNSSWIKVSSSRAALSWIHAALSGNPQTEMAFLGVTGTNGKTSTVWLTKALLQRAGIASLSSGTLGFYLGQQHLPSTHTTPDPEVLFPLLQQAKAQGLTTVVMEVSSHSLVQEKLLPLHYSAAGFTSFSRDHLDFHSDFASYWQAKWLLFRALLAPNAPAFFHGSLLPYLQREDTSAITGYLYGSKLGELPWPKDRCIELTIIKESQQGSEISFSFRGKTYRGTIPLWGSYNCENFLCAWLLAYARSHRGIEPEHWRELPAIPGRLQRVASSGEGKRPQVFIDYAHTPDALQQALTVLRRHCRNQLWLVFGCGGGRDQGKRKIMGEIASHYADRHIVTTDNPRHEEVSAINEAIVSGFPKDRPPLVIGDRREAITYALTHAQKEDLVLIAGKGHETTQTIGRTQLPFDDYQVAKKVLLM